MEMHILLLFLNSTLYKLLTYLQGGPKKTAHYTLVHIFAKY